MWYQDLAFGIKLIHQAEVVVVPLVIGALRTVSKDFVKWQEYLEFYVPDIAEAPRSWPYWEQCKVISSGRCYISKLREGAAM